MSSLKGSANYVWKTAAVLGSGAHGVVYEGISKQSGEPVAVKTFLRSAQTGRPDTATREFEVLKKCNHENIVKLLAIEEDVESHGHVIVMELCTGGSLFAILNDPANKYGLEEEEFLIVLKDLSAGMKHLRDKDIIHRDLKPGNIMKYIAVDGRSVYKLTDFDAARELQDDQQFQSLYGTEEYLHPDMYERAVLKQFRDKTFKATVDLWSIGVTLYHVATGSLPFQPYGGRHNRGTMHYITTRKASGVISGVQRSPCADIEWSTALPQTCLLSQNLQAKIVPLLAGLLECNEKEMWGFEKFFTAVTDILQCKVFHVFFVNGVKEVTVYLPPQANFQALKEELALVTGVAPTSALLLHEQSLLDPEDTTLASELPATSPTAPYFLFTRDTQEVKVQTETPAHATQFPPFPKCGSSLGTDASLAKTFCSVAHAIKRLVETFCRCHASLRTAPLSLASSQEENVKKQTEKLRQMKQTTDLLDRQLQLLSSCEESFSDLVSAVRPATEDLSFTAMGATVRDKQESSVTVRQGLTLAEKGVEKLDLLVVRSQPLRNKWEEERSQCGSLRGCSETATTYVEKIRSSWKALEGDKANRNFSYHDEQFHMLEKTKMRQTGQRLLSLLKEQCLPTCCQLAQRLQDWNRYCYEVMAQQSRVDAELESCSVMVASYASALEMAEKEFLSLSAECVAKLKTEHEAPATKGDSQDQPNATKAPGTLVNGEAKNSLFEMVKKKTVPKSLIVCLQQLKAQQSEIVKMFEESTAISARFVEFPSPSQESQD